MIFHELGHITFDNDGETVTVRLPKFGEWRRLRRAWDQAMRERGAKTRDLQKQAAALVDEVPKPHNDSNPAYVEAINSDRYRKLVAEIKEESDQLKDNPVWDLSIPWLAEVFGKFADKDLSDIDEWPAYLADPSLPGKFLNHWQTTPKASGPSEQSP